MSEPAPRSTVLVVDDNPTNRMKLRIATTALGHDVVEAEDGEAALEMLGKGGIDLVLLDIIMPGLDGYDVLRRMRAAPEMREIPVIVVSSLDDMADAVQAIELGAEDFLTKSFDPILLRARVRSCLERKRMRDRELDYLRDVRRLTMAAEALEADAFDADALGLDAVAGRQDFLGTLARVFVHMAGEVQRREALYRQRIGTLRGCFLLLLIGLLWGLAPTLAKLLSTSDAGSVGLTAWVTLISTLILVTAVLLRGRFPRITPSRLRFGILIGFAGTAVPQIAMFAAAEHVPATVISVLLALESLFVFAIAASLRLEEPNYRRFSGLLLGLMAILVIVLPGHGTGSFGAPLWVFVAMLVPLAYAGEDLAVSVWPFQNDDPLELGLLTMAGATLVSWPIAMALGDTPDPRALFRDMGLLLPLLACVSCAATVLLIVAIRRTGAVFASQTGYVITGAGVIWGVILLREEVSLWMLLALVLIAAGMVLVQPTPTALFGTARPAKATR